MKTKVVALLSIALLVFSVPVLADGISGNADYYQGQRDEQFQAGTALLDENGNTVGGEMYQSSEKEMIGQAESGVVIDCEDCGEVDVVGGFSYQSAGAEQMQFDAQFQKGVFGEASINIDKYFTMDVSKSESLEVNVQKNKTFTIDKDETSSSRETTVVDVDKHKEGEGEFSLTKNFEANAEGEVDHTTTSTQESDETSDTQTESDTWSASGSVDATLGVEGSGSYSKDKSFDLYKEETEETSETFDMTIEKNKDFHLDKTYTEECSIETHHGKTISWSGNGVLGAQVQGGYQSGYVQSTTAAGAINFDFDHNRPD